jgi:hypothetical protein
MITVKNVSRNVDTGNTHLVGYVHILYDDLVTAFGKPSSQRPSGDDKSRIEWNIKFSDNTVAAIYDWKNYGKTNKWVKENVTEWHIGGNNESVVNKIAEILKEVKVIFYTKVA